MTAFDGRQLKLNYLTNPFAGDRVRGAIPVDRDDLHVEERAPIAASGAGWLLLARGTRTLSGLLIQPRQLN